MTSKSMPLISVGFSIISDSADPERITNVLGLNPTKIRRMNDWPLPSIEAGLACNYWEISTEQETSKSVNEICKKIIDKLKGKEKLIQSLCNEFGMEAHFEVIVHMNSAETPAIYLEKESIKFFASINADIGFDVYAYEDDE